VRQSVWREICRHVRATKSVSTQGGKKVGEDVYYMTLDNWCLSKYINIASNNVDMIISNIQNLLMEMTKWKNENLQVKVREENLESPHGLIFFTYDKEVADRVFTNGYHVTKKEDLLKDDSVDLLTVQSSIDNRPSLSSNATEELDDSLTDALMDMVKEEPSKERLQVQLEDHLPDELFDDLEEIGLSTVDREVKSEPEDPLPEDLFYDLAESAQATVETEVKPEDE
jgi:uncharacterized protein YpiB (UPF0302 family)